MFDAFTHILRDNNTGLYYTESRANIYQLPWTSDIRIARIFDDFEVAFKVKEHWAAKKTFISTHKALNNISIVGLDDETWQKVNLS